MSFRKLVERLQFAGAHLATHDGMEAAAPAPEARPAWVADELVRVELDAGRLIASGKHPLGQVRSHAEKLGRGELVRLTSPFYPAPLIAVLRRGGLTTHTEEMPSGSFATYIRCRRVPPPDEGCLGSIWGRALRPG